MSWHQIVRTWVSNDPSKPFTIIQFQPVEASPGESTEPYFKGVAIITKRRQMPDGRVMENREPLEFIISGANTFELACALFETAGKAEMERQMRVAQLAAPPPIDKSILIANELPPLSPEIARRMQEQHQGVVTSDGGRPPQETQFHPHVGP